MENTQEATQAGKEVITVIVNARKKDVRGNTLSFNEVVGLAYDNNPPSGPNWVFTVAYRNGPVQNPEGNLFPGNSVRIKDGMIFDVTAADKS